MTCRLRFAAIWLGVAVSLAGGLRHVAAQDRALTFTDLMKFRQIKQPAISDDGAWIVFREVPDRGDGSVVARSAGGGTRYEVPLGSRQLISSDSRWVAMRLEVPFADSEKSDDDKPKPGMALLDLGTGDVRSFARVDSFGISADAKWFARLEFPPEVETDSTIEGADSDPEPADGIGGALVLTNLDTQRRIEIEHVRSFAFDADEASIGYVVVSPDSVRDGLYVRDLNEDADLEVILDSGPRKQYSELKWTPEGDAVGLLAFVAAEVDSLGDAGTVGVYRWDGSSVDEIVSGTSAPEGWTIPAENKLRWSKDRERLFFGFRPVSVPKSAQEDTTTTPDPYDTEAILSKKEVDVWHWNDPRINPQQKQVWKKEQARTYDAVYHLASGNTVPLADSVVLGAGDPDNDQAMLGKSPAPYFKDLSWDGEFFDLYAIDIRSGERALVAERLEHTAALSPDGRYIVYYRSPHWYVHHVGSGADRNVTASLDVRFSNEDHDYPDDAPGYGLGGWVDAGGAVLIYDKYDVWRIPLSGSDHPSNLTDGEGRRQERTFRVIATDDDKEFYEDGDRLLLSSYHNKRKNWGFYAAQVGESGVRRLLEAEKKFRFVAKAKDADVYLFEQEDYDEYPDLWVSDPDFKNPVKVTDLGSQTDGFAWGRSELVEWTSADGIPLQGVLIRPGNYEPERRYPVLVYFYRFMSQLCHEFNEPVVNHRPSFPLYASNGYAVFLPDIRFEIGRPGFSATKAIVPGVQKLIDMGVADPDAIGLHGHSWSGYQTAFIVTQTDIFAAAVAGAPVSNMTSAYGGIRWESGLGRQFQYEKTQSRLGRSLWEGRDRYIDNSPLFFADRIDTPLLLMFGDEDGAVPWYQGIELYLALRRLGKDAVFLQYRGEPHHLKKYPNKLDYSIKMKEYFDHYLKGELAPAWISEGIPYKGD